MRFLQFIAATSLALMCALAPACADRRVALVIGNAAYRHADRLPNPVNDAQGMRDMLTGLRFDVIYGEDLDLKSLRQKIGQFAGRVEGADVAVVYFAGHGATFGDMPYVVPVDAEFRSLDEVPYELVAVETLIGELRRARGVRIAILDACRDNGAEQELKRSRGGAVTRGLAPMKNPSGLIIAYATQHGATAADSAGARNSPFTAALLNNIATPGLDVTDMLRKVGREVDAATSGRQRPEISISMYDQYVLAPAAGNPADATPPAGNAALSDAERAERTWGLIQHATSLAVLDDFIRQFGNVPIYGPLARARREELAKQQTAVVAPPVRPPVPSQHGGFLMPSLPVSPADPCGGMVTVSFSSKCHAPLTAVQERSLKPKDAFQECENCPEMVVVPAGSFTMGSPADEKDRSSDEDPQHVVTISKQFAVGKLHVTVDQFAVFATETGFTAHSVCDWRHPGFPQEGSHPVVCVSWDDANAYANWLAKKTGKPYRLPSEAEWEYAARAGTTTPFWWGSSITPAQANYDGNYVYAGGGSKGEYRKGTVPDGSFNVNPWGLYNVHGNAWQWTADCYYSSYVRAPADGSVWPGSCSIGHVVRGGSWNTSPRSLRAAFRGQLTSGLTDDGFRLARTLTP